MRIVPPLFAVAVLPLVPAPADQGAAGARVEARATVVVRSGVRSGEPGGDAGPANVTTRTRPCGDKTGDATGDAAPRCRLIVRDMP